MSHLASAACSIDHFGLGWTAIDDEGTGERGGGICCRKPNKVGIFKNFSS
jgi:hypothetical protein